MKRPLEWKTLLFVLMVLASLVVTSWAQESETAAGESGEKSDDVLANIKFRNLGPAVGGGRVSAVVGIPGQPNVYYIGAAGGGVFKTTDGGLTWKAIFEKQGSASIGAIALAPSNPNLVWVGTGEANPRNDVITGRGVYFSPDGGASWRFMGLEDAGQISSILVHPTNPDIVWVGVLGHVWGPNAERGVFKTTDGGKSWQKVLFVNDKTGCSDLVMDPSNPLVLFAGMWEFVRYPWMLVSGGDSGGIYRSTDGGATWKKLSEGLPKPPTGRIGLAIAPSNPQHVYALVESKKGVLWDTKDLGEHWTMVSDRHVLNARPFYFSRLVVAPDNENHVYFLSFNIMESFDGGKTHKMASRGVHVDHHAMWIDPTQAKRMINGNDGGVCITSDAGKTWRYLDNMPIEQFYQVAVDDERPYLICGGLQDNHGWCGSSNSLSRGGITGADWWTAVGGDGEYIVPAGNKSNLVYADSQNGYVQRLDARNGMSTFIRPYLPDAGDMPTSELKYRFNWTSPIAVAPKDPQTVYLGGNIVFKSTDGGASWTPISGDLTRNDKSRQQPSGGPIELDLSGAETVNAILSLAVVPADQNVIWVGTDDGLVQVTRDGGKTWSNVTPAKIPEWGRVQQIEVSPFDPATCYVAFDYHEVDNNQPYVLRTHDFGKTWTNISAGLPAGDPARVVRENPNRKGMLVVGTDTRLFYSMDDGGHWTPLKSNFPTAPVYDMKFVKAEHDLVVATHGRGVFVFDDLTPLEESDASTLAKDFHLFTVPPAQKWHMWNKRNFFGPAGFAAPNPPNGAVISYFLKKEIEVTPEQKKKHQTPVKIVVSDADGRHVATLYGPSKQGYNRAAWPLQHQEPVKLDFVPPPSEIEEAFGMHGGPPVVPGTYQVAVTVNGHTQTQGVQVEPDPRYPFDMQAARAQTGAALEVRAWVSALTEALNRSESLKSQLAAAQKLLTPEEQPGHAIAAPYAPVVEQAKELEKKLTGWEEKVYNTEVQPGGQDSVHYYSRLHDRARNLLFHLSAPYDQGPSPLLVEEMKEVRQELDQRLADFNGLLKTDVVAFNKLALEHGANTLFAGEPITVKTSAGPAGAGN
jgi:photosystem II stability/assembly factor-like uncharacterized protein